MNLLDFFDRAYVINLPERVDRLRQTERELQRPGLGLRAEQIVDRVHFFPAIRPTEAAPFASVGLKGCSLSHLAVLRDARDRALERVLVLEDDVGFAGNFLTRAEPVLTALAKRSWGIVQLGHFNGPPAAPDASPGLVEFDQEVQGTHCYGVNWIALERLIAHFELQHRGVLGDNLRGPMSPDGTLNVFRWLNPDVPRFLVVPSLVGQRRSRSDVNPGRWDRLPLLRPLASLARAILAAQRPG